MTIEEVCLRANPVALRKSAAPAVWWKQAIGSTVTRCGVAGACQETEETTARTCWGESCPGPLLAADAVEESGEEPTATTPRLLQSNGGNDAKACGGERNSPRICRTQRRAPPRRGASARGRRHCLVHGPAPRSAGYPESPHRRDAAHSPWQRRAPHGVIVGPDGAPWITDGGLNAMVRVDPDHRSR